MSFMLMIVELLGQRQERGLDAGKQAYARMSRFTADLQARGVWIASESLTGEDKGVRVQVRAGRSRLVDGPYAEAKEMIGGFFLLNCSTLDEALAIAAECPAAEWCTVEVREAAPCYA